MSRSFITSMNHFLDEKGSIPQSLPKRARRFAENLGAIVVCVTAQPRPGSGTMMVPCWNKINRKQCSGMIDACIDLGSFNIFWHCLECGDHGSISGWKNTLWDGKHR
jgi:hypothetical protein